MCLNSHYRRQLVFSYENLDNAFKTYQKLKAKVQALASHGELDKKLFEEYDQEFKNHLSNDLNTANTITLIYDLLKSDTNDFTKRELIKAWDQVLSLDLIKKEQLSSEKKAYIEQKIAERKKAKEQKDFTLADQIREQLEKEGIYIQDTREGTTYIIK